MTAIAPAPIPAVGSARLMLALAARRTSAYATLRSVTRSSVDRLLADSAAVRQTPQWSEQFRAEHNTLRRTEELLIDAIDAERHARYLLTEAQLQEGSLS